MSRDRSLPIGAEVRGGGVHFRVWAPKRRRVEVVLETGASRSSSTWSRRRVATLHGWCPPAAPACAIAFASTAMRTCIPTRRRASSRRGRTGRRRSSIRAGSSGPTAAGAASELHGQVIYEMHIGTFTREGTWQPRRARLPELASAGITMLEVMPVAEFPGRFGWGYDGVNLFAPTRLYGTPRRFPPLCRPRPCRRPRRDPRCRLQPLRPGRQLPGAILATTYFTKNVRERMGRGDQLRRRQCRPGARVLHRQRRLLDR